MAETLIQTIRGIRKLDPTGIIQVCMAGRASTYMVASAMLLGVHSIRVGMEDTIYRWPHREDRVRSNAEVVADMSSLARILGRESATADDVRSWLAIPSQTTIES